MKAFISYSHQDSKMLELLHKHLTQLQRDGIISTWTDNQINPGNKIADTISHALVNSNLFLALLSADYIASNYCYEKEFAAASQMQEKGQIIIVPIIIEPCDWLNTPFKQFKALPRDGKPISTWENINTAFLDVIQNLRRLIQNDESENNSSAPATPSESKSTRNYRVQKDFDSIEKMEFAEKTFHEIIQHLKRYIEEVIQIDNIKSRVLVENKDEFECQLVNRNKIATEARLRVEMDLSNNSYSSVNDTKAIKYSIKGNNISEGTYNLSFDEYHLYWSQGNYYHTLSMNKNELTSKDMADKIWEDWLASVGII
jgi:hypothetical protein